MYGYIKSNELSGYCMAHHGILGQKWGIRRYQNSDGSLTSAGAMRYGYKVSNKGEKSIKLQGQKEPLKTIGFSDNEKIVKKDLDDLSKKFMDQIAKNEIEDEYVPIFKQLKLSHHYQLKNNENTISLSSVYDDRGTPTPLEFEFDKKTKKLINWNLV